MDCWKCGAEIPEGQNVCPRCYAPVRKPGLLSRLLGSLFQGSARERAPAGGHIERFDSNVLRRVQRIRVADPITGEERVYQSLDEVPPEIRARIEALRSGEGQVQARQTFTFRDESGNERTYHSVEEMPPDVRAIYGRIRREHGLGD